MVRARGLKQRLPGVVALDAVDFAVHTGEVHDLMGDDGVGKRTLIEIIAGVYPPDRGETTLDGKAVAPASPLEA